MTAAPHGRRPPDDDALAQPRLFIAVPVPAHVEAAITDVVGWRDQDRAREVLEADRERYRHEHGA